MARALTQDHSERTIGFLNDEDKYIAAIMFNIRIVSIISSESDTFRAYRVEIRPLHVEQGSPTTQEVIIGCEEIFR